MATRQEATDAASAAPDYFTFVSRWYDGAWYMAIADHGYPTQLPVDGSGVVVQNAWAFYPLYPMLVRAVMAAGGQWNVVAPLTSTLLGAAAMLVIYRLVVVGAPRAVAARPGLALASVAVICVFPTAPVLQTAYSESLALLLVATALLLMVRRHYWAASVVILALGFTRAIALPMVLVLLVHGIWRWMSARRGGEPIPQAQIIAYAVSLAVAVVSAFLWQWICQWVTGVSGAYFLTQQSWREGSPVGVFTGWLRSDGHPLSLTLYLTMAMGVIAFIAFLLLPSSRRVGVELYTWSAAYPAYLLAVVQLGTSLARYAILAFPVAPMLVGLVPRPPRTARAWLMILIGAGAVLQAAWLWEIWRIVGGDSFTPAP